MDSSSFVWINYQRVDFDTVSRILLEIPLSASEGPIFEHHFTLDIATSLSGMLFPEVFKHTKKIQIDFLGND